MILLIGHDETEFSKQSVILEKMHQQVCVNKQLHKIVSVIIYKSPILKGAVSTWSIKLVSRDFHVGFNHYMYVCMYV